MKKKKISFRAFNKYLKGVTIAQWFINLANIPIGLLTASLMSYVVTSATDGRTNDVFKGSVKLLLLLIGFRIFQSVYNIKLERAKSKVIHKCKLELYDRFLSGSLSALYSFDSGQESSG